MRHRAPIMRFCWVLSLSPRFNQGFGDARIARNRFNGFHRPDRGGVQECMPSARDLMDPGETVETVMEDSRIQGPSLKRGVNEKHLYEWLG